MKTVSVLLIALLFTSEASAQGWGWYGTRRNWNPYHPLHSWHAPDYRYSSRYRWGFRGNDGFGRCNNPYRCGR